MMPYKGTYLRLFSLLLRKPMEDEYGKKLTRKALKAAPAVYRQMMEKTDDIGADNPIVLHRDYTLATGGQYATIGLYQIRSRILNEGL